MSKPTNTFHLEFDTKSMPGKIVAVEVQIKRIVVSADSNIVFRLDLCDHPLFPALKRYVTGNPDSQIA